MDRGICRWGRLPALCTQWLINYSQIHVVSRPTNHNFSIEVKQQRRKMNVAIKMHPILITALRKATRPSSKQMITNSSRSFRVSSTKIAWSILTCNSSFQSQYVKIIMWYYLYFKWNTFNMFILFVVMSSHPTYQNGCIIQVRRAIARDGGWNGYCGWASQKHTFTQRLRIEANTSPRRLEPSGRRTIHTSKQTLFLEQMGLTNAEKKGWSPPANTFVC